MWISIIDMTSSLLHSGAASFRVADYGRVSFTGLINNRPLNTLTVNEIENAFSKVGMREAHNGHVIKRLIERGPLLGIHTLNDFARAINNAEAREGKSPGTVDLVMLDGRGVIVINTFGEFVTFTYG